MEFNSLLDLLDHEKKTFLEECGLCGLCLEACPFLPKIELSGKSPMELQEDLLEVLRGNSVSPQAYSKVFSCSQCGLCLSSCPEDLNPFRMQSVFKEAVMAQGQEPPRPRSPQPELPPGYDLLEVLGGLQIKSSEVRWLRQMPDEPEQVDLILFPGCEARKMPDQILAAMDILEKLDFSFIALAGEPFCCGTRYLIKGEPDKASKAISELIEELKAFKPQKVLFPCGFCYFMFQHEVPQFASLPFEVQFFAQFLCDNLSKFEFVVPLNETITVHDACNVGRTMGDYTSVRELLSAIPGANLMEMPHCREDSLCCGAAANINYPQVTTQMAKSVLEEARSIQAETLVDCCTGCHRMFSQVHEGYPSKIKHYVTVFAETLGIKYEDKLQRYIGFRDVDKVIEEAREYIESSPFSMEQTRRIVADFFNRTQPVV